MNNLEEKCDSDASLLNIYPYCIEYTTTMNQYIRYDSLLYILLITINKFTQFKKNPKIKNSKCVIANKKLMKNFIIIPTTEMNHYKLI